MIMEEIHMHDLGHSRKDGMLDNWISVERSILLSDSGSSELTFIPAQKAGRGTIGISLQIDLKFSQILTHGDRNPEDIILTDKEEVLGNWRIGFNSILLAESGEFKVTHDKGEDGEGVIGLTIELEIKFLKPIADVKLFMDQSASGALKIAKNLHHKHKIS